MACGNSSAVAKETSRVKTNVVHAPKNVVKHKGTSRKKQGFPVCKVEFYRCLGTFKICLRVSFRPNRKDTHVEKCLKNIQLWNYVFFFFFFLNILTKENDTLSPAKLRITPPKKTRQHSSFVTACVSSHRAVYYSTMAVLFSQSALLLLLLCVCLCVSAVCRICMKTEHEVDRTQWHMTVCASRRALVIAARNNMARGLSALLWSGCFIRETSMGSASPSHSSFVPFYFFLIIGRKEKKTFSQSSSSSLQLAFFLCVIHTQNPLFSVLLLSCIMSSARVRDVLQFGICTGGAKGEWEA